MQRDLVNVGEFPTPRIGTKFDRGTIQSMSQIWRHWWAALIPFRPECCKLNVNRIGLAIVIILSSMTDIFAQENSSPNTVEHQTVPITGYPTSDPDPCAGLLDAQGCISGKEFLDSQWNRGSGTTTRGYFLYSKPPGDTNTPDSDCHLSPKSKWPVIIATGEKTLNEIDFKDTSLAGLNMERTYRSSGESHLFGPGWKSRYAYAKLTVSPQCSPIFGYSWTGCLPIWIRAKTNDGIELTFYRASNLPMYFLNGQANNSTYGHINAFNTGVWTWAFRDRIYRYKSTIRSLESIDENGSRLLTFSYDLYGALQRIQSRTGRAINFVWTGSKVTSISDPTGRAWIYSYDGAGVLSSVTPPSNASYTRTYHYEPGPSRLVGYSVGGVRKTRYAYDSLGMVNWSGLDNGEEFNAFEYGTNYTIKRDHLGQSTRYKFESSGGLKRLVGVDRESTSTCAPTSMMQTYDAASGRLATSTDFRGTKTIYSYTSDGLLLSVVSAANTQESATLTNVWSVDRVVRTDYIGSNGIAYRRVEFTYGTGRANYWPVSKTETDLMSGATRSSVMSYTFHANGMLQARTLSWSLSGTTQAAETETFDSFGNLLRKTNAAGHITSYSGHDQLGRPAYMSDPVGLTTLVTYDSKGSVTSFASSSVDGSLTTTISYNGEGQVTQASMSNGWRRAVSYNSGGRLISIDGGSRNYNLDMASRTTAVTTKRDHPMLSGSVPYAIASGEFKEGLGLDSLGRPKFRFGALGQTTTESYDGEGNILARSDPAGRVTSLGYDAQGRIKQFQSPNQVNPIRYSYSPAGQLAVVTDPRNLSTSYGYNGFGQLISQISPDTGATSYSYDVAGRLIAESRADSRIINYVWDAQGRLVSRSANGMNEALAYDEGSGGNGRLTRLESATGTTRYGYNTRGQLTYQDVTSNGVAMALSWNYDSSGRLVGMTYPSGQILSLQYDRLGRLSAILANLGAGQITLADSMLYQPVTDRRYAWRFGNALPRMVTLDLDGRIAQLYGGAAHATSQQYTTNLETLSRITDSMFSSQSSAFGYDDSDRLRTVVRPGADQSYTSDPAGNRTGHKLLATGFLH